AKRIREANRTCLLTSKTKSQLSRNRCFKSGKRLKQREFPICLSFTYGFTRVSREKNSVVLCVSSVSLWWLSFLVISLPRHGESTEITQRNPFSDNPQPSENENIYLV